MPIRAMVLAAGFGTRLEELTKVRPKPMLPVCGAPLCKWAVLWLRHHGITEIVINLHHLGEQIVEALGDGSALGVTIRYSHEEGMILGTGGGLRHARHLLDDGSGEPIVVVNGKILVDLDLHAVLDTHRQRRAQATMVLRPDPEAARWGSLQLDAGGRVARLLGRTPADQAESEVPVAGPPLMFTGVQVLQPGFLDRIPSRGEQCVIRTAYRTLFDEYERLYGFVTHGYWWEHSTKERYLQGVFNVLGGEVSLPYADAPTRGVQSGAIIDPKAELVQPVRVAAGARVEAGARIGPLVQLEPGAVVRGGVRVQRSIVWDDAVVGSDTADAVIAS